MKDLERLRELIPAISTDELVAKIARLCREKLDPLLQKAKSTPAPESNTRYVPVEVKRRVWQRDHGLCTYQDPKTGRKCLARQRLQLDHIKPFAMGGKTTVENLRLRCHAHNQLHALQAFGEKARAHWRQ